MNQSAAIIWARMPTPNFEAKTRIGIALQDQSLANRLSLLLARIAIENIKSEERDLYLYHQDLKIRLDDANSVFAHNFQGAFQYQNGLQFMDNISRSIRLLLGLGYPKTVFLVSDCPYLNSAHLATILDLLNTHDVVLHPAADKGINAIGCKGSFPIHFPAANVISRSPGYQLLDEVESFFCAEEVNYTIASPVLSDVDTIEDVMQLFLRMSQERTCDLPPRSKELFDFLIHHQREFGIRTMR